MTPAMSLKKAPYIVLENRFAVPPQYVIAWLTDFREDDLRLYGMKGAVKVTRLPDGRIQRDLVTPMGPQRSVTTIEGPHRWTALQEDFSKDGRIVQVTHIVETVRSDGDGTHHRAELFVEARTFGRRAMVALMKPMAKSMLSKLFAQSRREMEENYRAGKVAEA